MELILRNFAQSLSIGRKHIGSGDVAKVFALLNHRDVILARDLEFFDHGFHGIFRLDDIFRNDGELLDGLLVERLIEHDAADVVEQHMATEGAILVDHREDVAS